MKTIYISDLDGTLMNDKAELSDFSYENLKALIADGLPFSVASARSVVSIRQMLRGLELPLPVICFNGAFLSNLATGEHELVNSIEPKVAESIFECLSRYDCVPYLSTFTGIEEKVYYNSVQNEGMQWYLSDRIARKDPRFQRIEDLQLGLAERVTCMTVINRKEILDELEAEISERFSDEVELHHFENEYSPGWYWLTVHDAKASKDQAIQALKDHCGLANSRIIAFGDNSNDVKMLKAADYAIAVHNAKPETKQHADEIIGSNMEDSVVKYLLRNWRNES